MKALGRVPIGQKEDGRDGGGREKTKTEKRGRSVLMSIWEKNAKGLITEMTEQALLEAVSLPSDYSGSTRVRVGQCSASRATAGMELRQAFGEAAVGSPEYH